MDFISIAGGLSGPFGYAVLFALVLGLSAVLFLPVPVFAVVIAASSVLDPFWVGLVAGIASAIGELTGYFAGAIGEHELAKKEGPFYKQSKEIFKKYGFWGIIAATISPITLIDLMGVIAGALRYGWKRFLLATLIGKIPRYMIVAYLGKKAMDQSFAFIHEKPMWSALAILIILAIICLYYFRFSLKQKKK